VETPETIHDFYGFPAELYGLRYDARGSPDLAGRVADLLHGAGLSCDLDRNRGLDHGAWVPLILMFPDADVPVVQLSIQRHLDPAQHVALGAAIATLRDDSVLILGSGGAVHPLGYAAASLGEGAATDGWAHEFSGWLTDAVTQGDRVSLVKYRERGPYASPVPRSLHAASCRVRRGRRRRARHGPPPQLVLGRLGHGCVCV